MVASPVAAHTTPGRPLSALLAKGRPLVMGILNVTPDSFSDGGRFVDADAAVAHARKLAADGADILDVGAESTRPDATPISADEERGRLEGLLPRLVELGPLLSIDTMKASVADWAVREGANIINDVWGLQRDPDMAGVVARHRLPVIVMHNREKADAPDIMADIKSFLARSLAIAERAGIPRTDIVLDPGVGFGKTPEQSMTAIARLAELKQFGLPLLVGASRKRFIDRISAAPPDRRIGGSIASHVLAVQNGAAIIRAHDVAETVQALRVLEALRSRQ